MAIEADTASRRAAAIRAAQSRAVEISVDASGVIIAISESCLDLLGWRAEDLIGTPLTRIIPQRLHDSHRAGFNRFEENNHLPLGGKTVRLPAVHAAVGEIEIDLRLRRADQGDEALVHGTLYPRGPDSPSMHAELTRVVQQAVGADLPMTELLQNCLAVAAEPHGWVAAAVWWIDPWMDRLRVVSIWEDEPGSYPHYVEETSAAIIRRGEGLVGSVWSTGIPAFHADLADTPELVRNASMVQDGLRRGLFFPLTAGGKTVGIVEMLDHHAKPFSGEDQEAVWVLADQLGRLVADRLGREQEAMHHQRVQTALAAGMMGVWSYHLATSLVTWDEELEAMYGLAPRSFGGSFDDYAERIHPEDRDSVVERIMGALERRERFDYLYRAVRPDGTVFWLQGAGAPVFDTEAKLQALTGVCFDVSERVEAQRQLDEQARHAALAADVGRALVGIDPLETRLDQTARAVVERLNAAFVRIWTIDDGKDELRLQASAGIYTHLDGQHSRIRVGEFKIGRIAERREPHLTNDVIHDPQISDPAWAEQEGMVSFAGYPLVVGDQLVGVLALFARHALPESTLVSLSSVADTVALAIQQARALVELEGMIETSRGHAEAMEWAMRDRAHVAEVLQSSLLPPSLPDIPGARVEASYRAGVEDVGGDFYDVFPIHGDWGFMIGDVCGRGPEAARLTALARHSLRTALLLGLDPAAALAALNEGIRTVESDQRFCTAICGTLEADGDEFVVRLAVGGHPHPLLLSRDGRVSRVGTTGPLIGVFSEVSHVVATIRLGPGDTLVFYTDGVIETRRGDDLFGEHRLIATLAELANPSAEAAVSAIGAAVDTFATETTDDVAVLAIGATPTCR